MSQLLSFELAMWICVISYASLLVLHVVLLVGAGLMSHLPIGVVWGGRLTSRSQLVFFETVALVITSAFLGLTLIHARVISLASLETLSSYSMWVLAAFFALNVAGNLTAPSKFEKAQTVVAALLSVATLRLALG